MKLKDASSLEEKLRHLDSILKSRDITLLTEVCIIKAMVFPVVMYRCESWTIKKAESQRLDTFEMWCWRRLETPLDSKEIQPVHPKGNQPWMFIGRTDAEAEAPIIWPRCAKSRLIGKDPGAMRWLASLTQWTWIWASSGRRWKTGKPGILQARGSQRVRHDLATEPHKSFYFSKIATNNGSVNWSDTALYLDNLIIIMSRGKEGVHLTACDGIVTQWI